jgi:hypothetical protein
MASRFVVVDNDVIEELKTSSENLNTRKSTNLLVGVFKKWAGRAALRNIGEDMETYEIQKLDTTDLTDWSLQTSRKNSL